MRRVLLVGLVVFLAGCEYYTPHDGDAVDRSQREMNLQIQKRLSDMQLAVAKSCIDKGGVPVFTNGNVDCKEWNGQTTKH